TSPQIFDMGGVERSSHAVSIIRQIFRELRKADEKFTSKSATTRFIMRESRDHQTTQKILCKAPNEMEHLASTYKHYLLSTRRLETLQELYKGGERSIAKSANLVGLELPERNR
uniref:Protein FMC1 homolog n=1 Tax=Parascaris univalens TaxID=6257 RepID=A0A914ZIV5_PARUN